MWLPGSASDCISMSFLFLKSCSPTSWHLIILRGMEEDVNSLCVTSTLLLTDTGRPLNLSCTQVPRCSSVCPFGIGVATSCTQSLGFFQDRHSWLLGFYCVCVCVFSHYRVFRISEGKKRQLILVTYHLWSKHFNPVLCGTTIEQY